MTSGHSPDEADPLEEKVLDIAAEALHDWSLRAEPFAVATVVSTSGSAPRPAGAAMAARTFTP
ncbi:hypothetical protein GCM10018780_45450 [Streptomyces lanatus]|nr:hypothetical protein GCM10018780_45450 [Streptomyces lanatus]